VDTIKFRSRLENLDVPALWHFRGFEADGKKRLRGSGCRGGGFDLAGTRPQIVEAKPRNSCSFDMTLSRSLIRWTASNLHSAA